MRKMFKIIQKRKKYHDNYDPVYLLPRNSIASSPTRKNMKSSIITLNREVKKYAGLFLDNN